MTDPKFALGLSRHSKGPNEGDVDGISIVLIKLTLVSSPCPNSSSIMILQESLVLFLVDVANSFGFNSLQTICSRLAAITYLRTPDPGADSLSAKYLQFTVCRI